MIKLIVSATLIIYLIFRWWGNKPSSVKEGYDEDNEVIGVLYAPQTTNPFYYTKIPSAIILKDEPYVVSKRNF
jgi:hypothetical protein